LVLALLMGRGAADTGIWQSTWLTAHQRIPPWSYLLTQTGVMVHYLRLALWPDRLCLDYGPAWPVATTVADALPELIVVGGLLLMTAWAWWRRPALGFVGAWFFLILAPTSSFVPLEDLVFEHRMYLPLAAVIVLGVIAAVALLKRLPDPWRRLEWGAAAVALALVVAFANLTTRRNQDYQSQLTIWRDTATKAPQNPWAHSNWGHALQGRGLLEEAIARYQDALRIDPNIAQAHSNLGSALQALRRHDEAIAHYQETLRIEPSYTDAHYNWGNALLDLGRFDEAIAHYQEALRIDPDFALAHNNWGNALLFLGRPEEAIAHFQDALRITPSYAEAHYNWGLALQGLGRHQEAMVHSQEALRLNPDLGSPRNPVRRVGALPE
jgi:tetratricopeptide (TPR) repeat protein